MSRALIITANGFQDQEAIYPYYRLLEAEWEVDIAAPHVGPVKGIVGVELPGAMVGIGDFWYDLLVIPGGVKAMEKVRLWKSAVEFVREFHQKGKVIASICSGAQLLISAGLVKGRVVSAYPAMKVDVENAGGTFREEPTSFDRIVTASHYRDLGAWMSLVFFTLNKERELANAA